MKSNFLALIVLIIMLSSCVPAKKYNELLEKEQKYSTELQEQKNRIIISEGKAMEAEAKIDILSKNVELLRADSSKMAQQYNFLKAQYDKALVQAESLEEAFDKYRLSGEKQTSRLQSDVDTKSIELQRKQDALRSLERELKEKQLLLAERETRVNELEELLAKQEHNTQQLKQKVISALKGFANKGLTINEKNGKIYVSLEAQLLFESGSTKVEGKGKEAIEALSKVLENEQDLEIIVEGHTDTDRLSRSSHPRNNWELSVLRATSVVEILLDKSHMNPQQISAAGRSEFLPADPTDKTKNRRIEIIIAPNLNELFKIVGE